MVQVEPCVPRDPFEAASSLANSLLGVPPLQRRGGRSCRMDAAFGTVSWPLNPFAATTDGYFGSGLALMHERTLVDYCSFQMTAQGRSLLQAQVLDGTGAGRRPPPWNPWMVDTLRPAVTCPLCMRESWERFGVVAWFWPHHAPFVSACWRHAVRLVHASELAVASRVTALQSASHAELAFARDSVSVCQLGRDRCAAARWLGEAMAAAGFRHANGEFRAKEFCAALQDFCGRQLSSLALARASASPRFGRRILSWINGQTDSISPVGVVLTLGCLREAVTTAVPVYSKGQPHRPRCRGWRGRYRAIEINIDGRHRYLRSDMEHLLRRGCSCGQVAALCHVSASTVWRHVKDRNLRDLIERLQEERCRREARTAWQKVRSRFPHASRNQLREREPRAYRWLVTHDKGWLSRQPAAYKTLKGWRRGVLKTAGSGSKILARLRSAIRTIEQNGRVTRAALCRELDVSPYILQRWSTASQRVARLLESVFDRRTSDDRLRRRDSTRC